MKISSLGTHIKVKDIVKSRKFYESLGFKPVFGYGDPDFVATLPDGCASAPEKYAGVVYEVSESSQLEIADGHVGIKNQKVFTEVIDDEKVSAMIKVDSLLSLFSNPNVNITFPVRRYYWGSIEVALRDPDGYVLVFIAPYSEGEAEAVSKFAKIEEVNNE